MQPQLRNPSQCFANPRKELSAVIECTREIASLARGLPLSRLRLHRLPVSSGSQWRDAVTLLADMPSCFLRPNAISYNRSWARSLAVNPSAQFRLPTPRLLLHSTKCTKSSLCWNPVAQKQHSSRHPDSMRPL